jgi:hypothetical protein
MIWMFNSIIYSSLQFDTIDNAPEPGTAETAFRWTSSSSLSGISQNKNLCEAKQCRIYTSTKFQFTNYVQHTLYTVLQDTYLFLPHQQQLFAVCVFWNPQRVCLVGSVEAPWCWLLIWWLKVIRTLLGCVLVFWYPGPSYLMQEVLVPYFFVCECPVCSKCIEERTV